ncbi:MAG: fumarylacetoacetate hydrolase family protein [Burkholderiales bacterium]|nr:fumarylacetoacetate hydrolase family protein [Burkholderiales bacterium]
MTAWVRYSHGGATGFGTLADGTIREHAGDMFAGSAPTGRTLALAEVTLLAPCVPSKMPALWNNFHERAAKEGNPLPAEPLYFLKSNNSFCAPGSTIRRPPHFGGKVIFEAELGIVIGRRASGVAEADALDHVFGYTCVNDVTAVEILRADPTFEQWTRSKGFDTFGPIGPVIATGLDPMTLSVRAILNGQTRQDYPVADMIFAPARLVARISRDMTLEPGDIIACGTSVGAGSMKPGSVIRIEIDGIGALENRYAD